MARRARITAIPTFEMPAPKRPGSLFAADASAVGFSRDIHAFNPEGAESPRGAKNGTDVGYEGITGRNVPWSLRGVPPPSGNRYCADECDED